MPFERVEYHPLGARVLLDKNPRLFAASVLRAAFKENPYVVVGSSMPKQVARGSSRMITTEVIDQTDDSSNVMDGFMIVRFPNLLQKAVALANGTTAMASVDLGIESSTADTQLPSIDLLEQ